MDQLADLVQSLPPELYDEIYDLTFTADEGKVVAINKDYRPPTLLQVDKVSRASFAKRYYGATIFLAGYETRDYVKWLKLLPISHRKLISQIRLEASTPEALQAERQRRETLGGISQFVFHFNLLTAIVNNRKRFRGLRWSRVLRMEVDVAGPEAWWTLAQMEEYNGGDILT